MRQYLAAFLIAVGFVLVILPVGQVVTLLSLW
jgi:hypothetical protein